MINKVILVGHLGKDPELKDLNSGARMASFSLATTKRWKDRETGERKEATTWHRVVVFNEHLVKVVEGYVKKGSKIYIEGELSVRTWKDKDTGEDRKMVEILLQHNANILLLDRRQRDDEPPEEAYEGA